MSDVELRPCPFCGGETQYSDTGPRDWLAREWIFCDDCGMRFAVRDGVELIAAWNRRATDELHKLTKEALFAAVDYIKETPCDPDITERQRQAWYAYQRAMKRYERARRLRGEDE